MKKILITGSNSYIGTSVENWLMKWPHDYIIDTIDMIRDDWKTISFCDYDVIFHVAAIVHRKEKASDQILYERVNHLLAVDVFKKAVADNVNQFIYMSTAAVYSQNNRKYRNIIIDSSTLYNPETNYGKTKLQAEIDILRILDENIDINTKVAIIRPPMIYGKNSRGNYSLLSKLVQKSFIFPNIKNARSMLFIYNLCEFIRLLIINERNGIYYPQNKEYVNITDLAVNIAKSKNKRIITTRFFNPMIWLFSIMFNPINKVFGNYIYDKSLSETFGWDYCIFDFDESIRLTEE